MPHDRVDCSKDGTTNCSEDFPRLKKLSLGDSLLSSTSPLPGRRLNSVRVKDKERPGLLRKLSGKQETPPTLVFTFTDEDGEDKDMPGTGHQTALDTTDGIEGLNIDHLLERLDHESVRNFQTHSLGVSADKLDTISMRSFITDQTAVEEENVPEEVIQERAQRFWDFFAMVSSITYAILLITIGVIMYAGDLFLVESFHTHYSDFYNIFLCSVGILWLLWFLFDIHRYIENLKSHCGGGLEGMKLVEGEDGEFHIEIPMLSEKKKIPEYYGFSKGRESGSFFLKIGAAVFCFGHLCNLFLHFFRQLHAYYFPMTEQEREICAGGDAFGPILIIHDVVYFVFSILQLFTIFTYGNVIVNKNKSIARFGFMHCISSSICFWMNTIKNETLDAYVEKLYPHDICDPSGSNDTMTTSAHPFMLNSNNDDMLDCTKVSHIGVAMSDGMNCVVETHHYCITVDHITETVIGVADWFYPFSIEFSILVVGVWYILWSHIGNIEENKDTINFLPTSSSQMGSQEELNRTEGHKQAMVLYADCSSSTKGMFIGLFLVLISFSTCLLMYLLVDECNVEYYLESAQLLECCIFLSMTAASASLYYKIAQRDVNPNPISFLDDLLLVICLPAFFMFGILSLVANLMLSSENWLWLVILTRVLSILQVSLQTPMIVDGLRRCSNTAWAQEHRAGRNTLMFMIVSNLAVYIFQTFLLKTNIYQTEVEFYTLELWMVLSHMTLPLCIFYRFHSAVALADIWSSAYKPADSS